MNYADDECNCGGSIDKKPLIHGNDGFVVLSPIAYAYNAYNHILFQLKAINI